MTEGARRSDDDEEKLRGRDAVIHFAHSLTPQNVAASLVGAGLATIMLGVAQIASHPEILLGGRPHLRLRRRLGDDGVVEPCRSRPT